MLNKTEINWIQETIYENTSILSVHKNILLVLSKERIIFLSQEKLLPHNPSIQKKTSHRRMQTQASQK